MSTMSYISKSGKTFTIERARGNLSGARIGFYVWDEGGNLVCDRAKGDGPVEPFATIEDAEAAADER